MDDPARLPRKASRQIHGPHLAFPHPLGMYTHEQIQQAKRVCILLGRGKLYLLEPPEHES